MSTMHADPDGWAAGLRQHLAQARASGADQPGTTLTVAEVDVVADLLEELVGVYYGTGLARLAAELAVDLAGRVGHQVRTAREYLVEQPVTDE